MEMHHQESEIRLVRYRHDIVRFQADNAQKTVQVQSKLPHGRHVPDLVLLIQRKRYENVKADTVLYYTQSFLFSGTLLT